MVTDPDTNKNFCGLQEYFTVSGGAEFSEIEAFVINNWNSAVENIMKGGWTLEQAEDILADAICTLLVAKGRSLLENKQQTNNTLLERYLPLSLRRARKVRERDDEYIVLPDEDAVFEPVCEERGYHSIEQWELLKAVLAEQNLEQKKIFYLLFVAGYSPHKVAEALEIEVRVVYERMYVLRKRLASY